MKTILNSNTLKFTPFKKFNKKEIGVYTEMSTVFDAENAESESEVLEMGLSVIMLNLGMYLGVPAIVVVGIRKRF